MTDKPWDVPYPKNAELDASRDERLKDDYGFIAEMLNTCGVPAFSPGVVGWMLSDVLPPLEHAIQKIEQSAAREPLSKDMEAGLSILKKYQRTISDLCYIAAHQQRGVIDEIQRTLRHMHAQDLGIPEGQEDNLEDLLKLMALADLGREKS